MEPALILTADSHSCSSQKIIMVMDSAGQSESGEASGSRTIDCGHDGHQLDGMGGPFPGLEGAEPVGALDPGTLQPARAGNYPQSHSDFPRSVARVLSDNRMTVTYVNQQRGTHSPFSL